MDKYDMKMETDPKTIPGKMMNRIQTNSVVLEFGCAFGRMTKYEGRTTLQSVCGRN